MLKIVLVTVILVGIAFAGLAIRILLERDGQFSGGSCQASDKDKRDGNFSCGCGAGYCQYENEGSRD